MESTKLRKTFGPYPATLATSTFEAVQEFIALLPENTLEGHQLDGEQDTKEGVKLSKNYFGHKLKFDFLFDEKDFDELYSDYSDKNDQNRPGDNFVELFRDKINIHSNDVATTASNIVGGGASHSSVTRNSNSTFSPSWLFTQCERHVAQQGSTSGLGAGDLSNVIFEVLQNASRSNDDIQSELFDLLGFEAFDLIQEVLQHRHDIVQASLQQLKDTVPYSNGGAEYQYIDPTRKFHKPVPGQQVTIQTEQEKTLSRKMQKEERKMMRKDPELYHELFKANREQEQDIRTQPLFVKATTSATQKYPFVFDEFASRKHQSSFIGGTKVLLPETARKNVYPRYEEIDIPATSVKPPEYLNKYVKIESMDEVSNSAILC